MPAATRRGRAATPAAKKKTVRHCTKCGEKHAAPTGKKCKLPPTSGQSNSNCVISDDMLASTILSELSQSPTNSSSPIRQKPTEQGSIDMVAVTCNKMMKTMAEMGARMDRMEKKTETSTVPPVSREEVDSAWANISLASGCSGRVRDNICRRGASSRMPPLDLPANAPRTTETVTATSLRADNNLQRRVAEQQAELLRLFNANDLQGTSFCTAHVRPSVKSGRDRTGSSDQSRVYVKWPQQAVFIGPARRRVKYDELTQSQ